MIKVSKFRSCKNTPPKEDGYYLVVKYTNKGEVYYASDIHYSVKWGWNSYSNDENDRCVIHFENEPNALWAILSYEKGKKK